MLYILCNAILKFSPSHVMLYLNFLFSIVFPFQWAQNFTKSVLFVLFICHCILCSPSPPSTAAILQLCSSVAACSCCICRILAAGNPISGHSSYFTIHMNWVGWCEAKPQVRPSHTLVRSRSCTLIIYTINQIYECMSFDCDRMFHKSFQPAYVICIENKTYSFPSCPYCSTI